MPRAQRRSREQPPENRSSADPEELEKFSALADEWWDPDGAFAPLHRLNPLRLAFIRRIAAQRFGRDEQALATFAGLSLIDIGCGGGLISEPLARQGFDVLGIDAASECIAAAQTHQATTKTVLEYRCADAVDIVRSASRFDVAVAMEVVEHVTDRQVFLESCAALLKPGGLLFVATIARTIKALALAKFGAEYLLRWIPPGTHDWNKFVSPRQLARELEQAGLSPLETLGISFDPFSWRWRTSPDTDVNYMIAAAKPENRSRRRPSSSR